MRSCYIPSGGLGIEHSWISNSWKLPILALSELYVWRWVQTEFLHHSIQLALSCDYQLFYRRNWYCSGDTPFPIFHALLPSFLTSQSKHTQWKYKFTVISHRHRTQQNLIITGLPLNIYVPHIHRLSMRARWKVLALPKTGMKLATSGRGVGNRTGDGVTATLV